MWVKGDRKGDRGGILRGRLNWIVSEIMSPFLGTPLPGPAICPTSYLNPDQGTAREGHYPVHSPANTLESQGKIEFNT
jgi:hypothetical protein